MPKFWTIRWKALLMLVTFTVNFCVICHCAAKAAPVTGAGHMHSCCGKPVGGDGALTGKPADKKDCPNGCGGMQAVKFNLLEKQVSSAIVPGEQPVLFIAAIFSLSDIFRPRAEGERRLPELWGYKHAPPDLQVLYQRFRI